MADPWWQRWLVPDQPGLRQFWLVSLALASPLPAVVLGPEYVVPALAIGITLGIGLGVGWGTLYARTWFRARPINTIVIFVLAAACLVHVEVLPRWELLLRVIAAREDFSRFALEVAAQPQVPLPSYIRGPDQVRAVPHQGNIVAWTPVPLRRWSLLGWKDRVWIVQPREGETVICWTRAEVDRALGR